MMPDAPTPSTFRGAAPFCAAPARAVSFLAGAALAALVAVAPGTIAAQEASPPAPQGGIGLDMGTPVDESGTPEPQVGEAYDLEEAGDWTVRCVRSGLEHDGCFLHQPLPDQGGTVTAEVELLSLPATSGAPAGMTIVTPLGTLLTEGITLSVDDGQARRYQFSVCNQVGCIAQVGLPQEQLDALRRGAEARIRIVPAAAADQNVVLPISLIGVTAGFDRITALNELHREALAAARAAQGEAGGE